MVTTKIVKTIERYDKDGKLIERIVREESVGENNNITSNPNSVASVCPLWKECVAEEVMRQMQKAKQDIFRMPVRSFYD